MCYRGNLVQIQNIAREISKDKWHMRRIRRYLGKNLLKVNHYIGNHLQLIDSRVRLRALSRLRWYSLWQELTVSSC